MAQDAEGTRHGRRSAAGPVGERPDDHMSASKRDTGGGTVVTEPVRQDRKRNSSGDNGQGETASSSKGQSSRESGGRHEDQQSGRKRRRSRSRRNKNRSAHQAEREAANQNEGRDLPTPQSKERSQRKAGERTKTHADNQSAHGARDGQPKDPEMSANGARKPRRRTRGGKGRRAQVDGSDTSSIQEQQKRLQNNRKGSPDRRPSGTQKSQASNADQPVRPNGAERDQSARYQKEGQRRRHRKPDAMPKSGQARESYAALDLGTNNCRLLVAEPHGQSFRVVDAFSRIVRLGEGLSQSGDLSEEAQDRAISALKVCQAKLSNRAVKRFRLIATEACRRAGNGAAFLNRVHRETGLKLEIVNRETEARLAVAGCASLVHPEADGVLLFDIGGGSSEIVWLDLDPLTDETTPLPGEKRNRQTRRALRHLSERIRCWTSLQVGVVTLSEKHGGHIVTRDNFEAMVNDVRGMLTQFEEREALSDAIKAKNIHMLGTSGTVTTLAGVHLGLERYDRRLVDGTWLTATEVRTMITRVLEMDFEERIKNPCIGQDRADLVLAGCAILEAFHREWPCSQLRVADRGLREGILMEMMIDDGVWTHHQSSKKPGSQGPKRRRSRRRGGRGQRGQNSQKQAATVAAPKE